jgi:hypothetical protein
MFFVLCFGVGRKEKKFIDRQIPHFGWQVHRLGFSV